MVSCRAFKCTNRTDKKMEGITFHRFPSDPARRKLWIKNVRLKNWAPAVHDRLCSVHFEEKFFYSTDSTRRLLPQAVPTIFPSFPSHLQPRIKTSRRILKRISADPTFGTKSVGEGTPKLSPGQKTLKNKLDQEMKTGKTESHKRKTFLNGDINNLSQSSKERSSPYDEDDKEFNTVVIEVSNSESSEWSLSELPPVKNIKPSVLPQVLPHNSENEFSSAEFNDENMLSLSASENGDNESLLDENMSEINYSSDDMDDAFKARMDYAKSQQTIADLKQKVRSLQRKNGALRKKVHCLKSFFCYLEKNNFLNQYAGAAVKAVMSGGAEPP